MMYKWLGAILVIAGCGGTGFSIAQKHKKEENSLQQFLNVLQLMESELAYKLTPLPELCCMAAKESRGSLKEVFRNLTREMEWQSAPDAASCMSAAIRKTGNLSVVLRHLLLQLGQTLGRFDLPGQLKGMQSVKENCQKELNRFEKDREMKIRTYQTLGLCAGIALAILLV